MSIISCSISTDKAYQRGYQEGYAIGQKTADTYTNAAEALVASVYKEVASARDSGYKDGYQKGFDESTRLFGPKDELVKVLSYKLTRDSSGWVEVVGELQSLSNKTLTVWVTGALLN